MGLSKLLAILVLLCFSCQQASQNSDRDLKEIQSDSKTLVKQESTTELPSQEVDLYKKIDPEILAKVQKPYNIESYMLLFERGQDYDEYLAALTQDKESINPARPKYFVSKININGGYLLLENDGDGETLYREYVQWNLPDGKKLIGFNYIIASHMVDETITHKFEFVIFDGDKWLNADIGILNTLKDKSKKDLRDSELYKTIFRINDSDLAKSGSYLLELPEKGKDLNLQVFSYDEATGGDVLLKEVTLKWNDGKFEL